MDAKTSSAPWCVFPGLFLISAATLLLEVVWIRVLSVTLWYHFAFMVLSTALFGFGFAGVLLSVLSRAGTVSQKQLTRYALAAPVAFLLSYIVSNAIPYEPFSLGRDNWQWLYLPIYYLTITLPFFFSGLTIASILTRHADEVHRLYLFDLLGAGTGAVAVVFLLPWSGGSGTILFATGLFALGSALINYQVAKKWSGLAGLMAISVFVAAPYGDSLIPVRVSGNKVTGDGVKMSDVFSDPKYHRFTAWNSTSRVDVIEWKNRRGIPQRTIFIDGGTALTRLAHPLKPVTVRAKGIDEESFFISRMPKPRVLVVGSGGGREVLLALRNDASKVTAVEINPAINTIVEETMADFTGDLYKDPRVTSITDEARSFLERNNERFGLIHCPHTISNAAMASGSLNLAENYLMTREAFSLYLGHLTPNGTLLITRPEAHLPRLFSTVREVLRIKNNNDIANQLIAWRRPNQGLSFYAGFVFKPTPFSKEEISDFANTLKRNRLQPVYLPYQTSEEPYQSIVKGIPFARVPKPFSMILEPATDDMPFFNRRIPFSKIGIQNLVEVFSRGEKGRAALEDQPITESALIVLLLETIIIAGIFIFIPLFVARKRSLTGTGQGSTITAFFFLGLAYITVEMGMVHKLTLYLGRPTIVFATVLGTLLVSSGLGSAFSRRFSRDNAPWWAPAFAGVVGLVTALMIPVVVEATLSYSQPVRIAIAVTMLTIPGFFMGMPFPQLIRQLKNTYPERIPWALGINGFASVAGTIASVLFAMTLGQTAVLLIGVVCYGAAAFAIAILSKQQ